MIQLKVLKLCSKKNTKHFEVICIQFSQNVEMQDRNGTKLPPFKLIWISLSEQQPFVLL